ncbi:hypothetical protein HNR46_000696 [Haloferula luteola]|uniref:Uncharacterized protein n=1 Tax=Haloferula luteola TaxID=595692 RepID=A0A840UXH6_9BACT|nr:hypothetical protein [Haloferula luteola]MBB5350472.1 hypothetical protein [Haloferula luteola]
MKPATSFSLLLIAVLATVVVEERRIKDLRKQLDELRALREATPSATLEPPVESEPLALPPSQRTLPKDFPLPTDEQIKELALSDRADLYLQLGLTSTEQAYVESIVKAMRQTQQELAVAWVSSDQDAQGGLIAKMNEAEAEADTALRAFFNNESDIATFRDGLAMQADIELYHQLSPYLAVQGATFNKAKETAFIEALHQIRTTIGGIDWNSPEALPFFSTGSAEQRFDEEWEKIDDGLKTVMPVFLNGHEIEAVVSARKELYDSMHHSLFPSEEDSSEAETPAEETPEGAPSDAPEGP